MKLTKLETYVVQNPPKTTAFGGPYFYLVKLSTDEGIYGWGETATLSLYHPLQQSYKTLMDQIFDVYLKGQNALDRERLNKTLYAGLTVRHPEYSTGGLISAIDLALWDIAGKACGQPVYNLLGGAFRKKVRSYSYIYPDPQALREVFLGKRSRESLSDPKRFADTALQMVEDGFTGLKLDPVPFRDEYDLRASDFDIPHIQQNFVTPHNLRLEDFRKTEKILSAIRDAIGERADILFGTHGQMTTAAAIRMAKVIEPFEPLWFEEPVPPENTKEMAKVARSTTVPIATGERLATVFDFTRLLEDGAAVYLQPDLGSCGGITECKKIAAIAEGYYAQMAPHVWGGPVITAAALHIDASIPNFLIQESIYKGDKFFDQLLTEPFEWIDGYYTVPTKPGLGIDLNMNALEKYRV